MGWEGDNEEGEGAVAALTRTKMSVLESPTLYFPSETLTMGNCEGQEQQPRISRTCGHGGEGSVGRARPAVGSVGSRTPLQGRWGTDPPLQSWWALLWSQRGTDSPL